MNILLNSLTVLGFLTALVGALVIVQALFEHFFAQKSPAADMPPEELFRKLKNDFDTALESLSNADIDKRKFLTVIRALITDKLPDHLIVDAGVRGDTVVIVLRHTEYPQVTFTTTIPPGADVTNPAIYSETLTRLAEYKRDPPERTNALPLPTTNQQV